MDIEHFSFLVPILIQEKGVKPDIVFTSKLRRSVCTARLGAYWSSGSKVPFTSCTLDPKPQEFQTRNQILHPKPANPKPQNPVLLKKNPSPKAPADPGPSGRGPCNPKGARLDCRVWGLGFRDCGLIMPNQGDVQIERKLIYVYVYIYIYIYIYA